LKVREARLKQEFAHEYPGIAPGLWIPVKEFARLLVERVNHGRRLGRFTRTFDPTHFEFRGGNTAPRSDSARTRRTDRKSAPAEDDSFQQPPLRP
jgi:hypothetical protein